MEAVPQPQEMTMSLFDLFLKGGAIMWVLLALSIIAIYIFGKKWWMIRKAGQIDRNFMREINSLIHDGKFKSAAGLCSRYDSPVARMVEKGIERAGRPLPDIQAAVENTGNVEVAKLERGLPMLASIGSVSPYIGLFGTVWGIMDAFTGLSSLENVSLAVVAPGIAEALVATAVGLFAAIPATAAYNLFANRIERLSNRFESFSEEFLNILAHQR